MKRYRIEASLESPIVVRRERQSQRSAGVNSITGTLLRGALAQAYLQQNGTTDRTFQRLFLDEDACRFGPLDPADRVFPLTATSCKRTPGLGDRKHGVVDGLPALLRSRMMQSDGAKEHCPRCPEDLKPHRGFWYIDAKGTPAEPRHLWRQSLMVHVGIDRSTQTAAESILFTLPALEPERHKDERQSPGGAGDTDCEGAQVAPCTSDYEPPKLTGWVQAEDDAVVALRELLAMEDNVIRVGHARTRGYGRLKIDLGDVVQPVACDCLGWSEKMLSRVAAYRLDPDRSLLFAISLPTGAILLDELLRYTLDPAGMVPWLPPLALSEATGFDPRPMGIPFEGGVISSVAGVAQHERLRGWNAAHGLPRHDEWAISRGAVYVYLYVGDVSGRGQLLQKLDDLQNAGIGARRNEGFGQVLVSDGFHCNPTFAEAK